MSVVTTRDELAKFLHVVYEECGDASGATCLMFVPWIGLDQKPEERFAATWDIETSVMLFEVATADGVRAFPIEISIDGAQMGDGLLIQYGVRQICKGVWALNPSLYIPEMLHGYVALYGVPDPAPWERRIILATSIPGRLR